LDPVTFVLHGKKGKSVGRLHKISKFIMDGWMDGYNMFDLKARFAKSSSSLLYTTGGVYYTLLLQ